MSNNLNWTIAYKTVFGEKKVESFTDKKEADARYEALLARTYGSLGDIAGVTKPVQSGAKVTESKEQKTPKNCESWVVDYKRLFDSEIESEEFDNLTDANEFYNRLMDDAEGYEFIDEPRDVDGLEECGGSSAASLGAIPTGVVRQNDESKKSEEKDRLAGYKPYSFKVKSKDPTVLKNDAEAVLTEFAEDVVDNTSFKFDYDWYDKSWELTDTKTNQVFSKGTFLFKDFAESTLYLDDGVLATPAGMKLRTWMAVSDADESKKSESLAADMSKAIQQSKPKVLLSDDAVDYFNDYDSMLDQFEGAYQTVIHINGKHGVEEMWFIYEPDDNIVAIGDFDVDRADAERAKELMEKFVRGELTEKPGNSDDLESVDYIAIVDGNTYTSTAFVEG